MKLAIAKLPKQKGGRIASVETYIAYCNEKNCQLPQGWLIQKKSIKTLESVDIFAQAFMENKVFVLKVYEKTSPMFKLELSILRMLSKRKQHNVIHYICDSSHNDCELKWNTRTENDDALHFIMLEYIENGNIHNHLGNIELTFDEMKSVLKQVALCLLQISLNYNINHGNIHPGNILIQRHNHECRTYKIKNQSVTIDTYDIEPIFIDFGRAHRSKINWKTQEVLQTFYLIKHIVVKETFKIFIAHTLKQNESYSSVQITECIDYIATF
jgi:serine/threonine protein kinase